jgi:2,4-dienoyl-CoA reductase-like NADH-dependent reductase (Old Yellow Enzyme family)
MKATTVLAQPLTLASGEVLPNRLAKAAMTEGLADIHGRASEDLVRLYRRWGEGGCGLLLTGNVQVDAHHLERPGNVIVAGTANEAAMNALRSWVKAARSHGAGFWMQLAHAGRQTPRPVNRHPKAPSAVPLALPGNQFGAPVALREDEIGKTIDGFVSAAGVAQEAGFSGVQLHAAHGYLISQFLSPRANVRTDRWGGSLENRARLLLTIVDRTRAAVGKDFTLAVKLNSADFQRGGFSADDSLQVAGWLATAGIDVLEVSGGTYEQPRMMDADGMERPDMQGLTASTAAREGYFLKFAREMQQRVKIPLMVTGGFRTADAMASAVEKDAVSIVGLARPLCTDHDGPGRLLREGGSLDRPEARLRIGPGWLGPQSPVKLIKSLNGFMVMSWYYQQLRAVARDGRLEPSLGVLPAFFRERKAQMQWLAEARSSGALSTSPLAPS